MVISTQGGMSLIAINYTQGKLNILNQLLLPQKTIYEDIKTIQDGWKAINSMKASFNLMYGNKHFPKYFLILALFKFTSRNRQNDDLYIEDKSGNTY